MMFSCTRSGSVREENVVPNIADTFFNVRRAQEMTAKAEARSYNPCDFEISFIPETGSLEVSLLDGDGLRLYTLAQTSSMQRNQIAQRQRPPYLCTIRDIKKPRASLRDAMRYWNGVEGSKEREWPGDR
jgi:hypothetical protein